ncbi:hypothetical protein M8818_006154 [Zalaria obscura]|uniref:Uncharacterized protein n=1 Tax=Zalaria obscura TaxID=2024903 RepID=A0ACC3S768_9PEZI
MVAHWLHGSGADLGRPEIPIALGILMASWRSDPANVSDLRHADAGSAAKHAVTMQGIPSHARGRYPASNISVADNM